MSKRTEEESMSPIRRTVLAASVAALALSAPTAAHHAVSAEFDETRPVTFTGTVKLVDWRNPHIYTHVETKDEAGRVVVYKVEGSAPNALFRQGWRKDTLKIGESVTVSGLRSKIADSMNIGQATLTTADGRRLYAGSYQPGSDR